MDKGPELRRDMGLIGATAVIVGGVIGSGIFFKPHGIAQSVPDPLWVPLLWAGVGVVCLFGAFAYAELGCLFPEAGGQYAFLRESWGRFTAFLYGWCFLLVINTGTLAALAAIFADTIADLAGFARDATGEYGFEREAVAVAMILALAVVNHVGVRYGALLQTLSTVVKVLGLLAIIAGGLLHQDATGAPAAPAAPLAADIGLMAGLVSAAVAIFWAYEGWYQLPFNAAEMKRPERDLPRALIYGTAILIVLYLAMNAVYLHVVPFAEMRALASDVEVPKLTIARAFGASAGDLLLYFLCLSVFGAANPCLLSSPRAMYAMSKDGLLPHWLTRVDARWGTPVAAIWAQALWSIALVLGMRTFKDLTVYAIFAALIFYAMTVAGVYILRARAPERERPYRCWGYPVTPALFIVVALVVDAYTLSNPEEQRNALIGLAIIATGVPAYFVTRRGGKRQPV